MNFEGKKTAKIPLECGVDPKPNLCLLAMQKTPEVDLRLMKKRQKNKRMEERLEEALGATADKHVRLRNPQTGEINR